MTGRTLRIAGSAAALAILVGGAIWWTLGGAAGAGPDAGDRRDAASSAGEPAVPGALPTSTLSGSGAAVRPLAPGSARIEGVVRRSSRPTAARVLAYVRTTMPGDEPAVASTGAGDDGRFAIGRLPAGTYEVVAEDAAGHRGATQVSVALSGQRVGCEIRLREGEETLRGRVIDVGGGAWRGRVTALPHTAELAVPMRVYASVETDPEGRFVLAPLEAGRAALHGWDTSGLEWTAHELDLPCPRELVIDLGAGTRELTGIVLDAVTGQPVPEARLVAYAGDRAGFDDVWRRVAGGADGRFRIRVPAGAREVGVHAAGYASAWIDLRRPDSDATVRLLRTGRITGRVLRSPGGAGVAGASVTALALEGDMHPIDEPAPAESDASGTYTLEDVTPGDHLLSVLGGGVFTPSAGDEFLGASSALRVHVGPGATSIRDIVARPAGRLEGVVLDGTNAPVVGALVRWSFTPERAYRGDSPAEATSGPDGRFTFETVVADEDLLLQATAVGFAGADCEPQEPRVRAGETTKVTLRMGLGRTALVTVVDTEDRPVPGAWLSGWKHAVTGADGTALFPSRTGDSTRVFAKATGYVEGSGLLEDDGRTTPSLRIVLARGLLLAGRVVGAAGQAIPGAQVQVEGPHRTDSVRTDTEGRFRTWVAVTGPWTLSARADGAPWEGTVEVKARAPDEGITLVGVESTPGGFPLRILDPEGRPVPHGKLLVDPEARPRYERVVPGEGVRVEDPASSVVLEVFDVRDESDQPLPYAPARSERIPAGRTEPFEFRLDAERALEGRVVDAAGRAVVGVRLEAVARVEDGEGNVRTVSPVHGDAVTDDQGRFRLGGLWTGPYRVHVAGGEGFSPPDPISLEAPASGVRIEVHPSVDVDVTVVGADGRPIPDARVVARRTDDADGRSAISTHTDPSGIGRLERLDPTLRYHLGAEPPEAVTTAFAHEVRDWTPGPTTVRLPRAQAIAGRVVDEEGGPVPFAELWVVQGEFRGPGTADAKGAFEVGRLVPGIYSVEATPPGERGLFPTLWGKAPAAAGTSDVVVTVPGRPLRLHVDDYDFSDGAGAVHVGLVEASGVASWRQQPLYRGKDVTFPGLDPGNEYVVFVLPGPDGQGAVLEPVHPRTQPYSLRVGPGRVVTGRAVFPDATGEVTEVTVPASGTVRTPDGRTLSLNSGRASPIWAGSASPNGTFRVPGLPEGSFWVTLEARIRGVSLRASARETGAPLAIPIGGR